MDKDIWIETSEDCPWSYSSYEYGTYICTAKLGITNRPQKEYLCCRENCAIYYFMKGR